MKAFEVMGTVDEQGQVYLDIPLGVDKDTRVKVIVLLSDEGKGENNDDEDEMFSESARESFRQGWYDVMRGNVLPVSVSSDLLCEN